MNMARSVSANLLPLTVAICGDTLHSRVARPNIVLLNTMGARVRVVAPRTLSPAEIERLGVEVFHAWPGGSPMSTSS